MVKSLWCRCFLSISVVNLDSRRHFNSKSFQRFNYFNKIEYFTLMERVCEIQFKLSGIFTHLIGFLSISLIGCRCYFFQFHGKVWVSIKIRGILKSLYDHFFQFRWLIQIPNHSRDSIILIKLNTLHSWKSVWESIQIRGITHLIG